MACSLPTADIQFILDRGESLFRELRATRIFMTGGTGLFGKWLLASVHAANVKWDLGIQVSVLSRDPQAFLSRYPEFKGLQGLQWLQGDVRTFQPPEGVYDSILHGATEASVSMNLERPIEMLTTQVEGTHRVLEMASRCRASQILLMSSGAVYGKIPSMMPNVSEDYTGAPDPLAVGSAYGEGKRATEQMVSSAFRESGLKAKITRTFAVVGPYLPMDTHFAIGNFMRDGMRGQAIQVAGDGTPTRSYLHMAEHTLWLWAALVKGEPNRAYNVGSDEGISIADLARLCGEIFKVPVSIAKKADPGAPIQRYVPDVTRSKSELGLRVEIPLRAAIERTAAWLRERGKI